MDVTAAAIKQLREETGAGFALCKQALSECDGDDAKAKEWLNVKGASAAQKKAGRATTEGAIAAAAGPERIALAEVLTETDFVAGNEAFRALADAVAAAVLAGAEDAGELDTAAVAGLQAAGGTVEELRAAAMLKIGENIQLGRAVVLAKAEPEATLHSYIHHNSKIGVVACVACGGDKEVGKNICLQIASMRPQVIAAEDFDAAALERVKQLFVDELADSGKPDAIKDKIAAGKLKKYLSEQVLLQQEYIKGDGSVAAYLDGHQARVLAFRALHIG